MKTIGIIPARYGSSRFPGKPLAGIAGKSLIRRVYEQVIKAGLDKVIVATDDRRIEAEVAGFGGIAVLTGEHDTGTGRIAEAASKEDCDLVINIQGDEPLINPEVIRRVCTAIEANPWASVSTAAFGAKDEDLPNPNVVKVVFAADGRALYFSRSLIPYPLKFHPGYFKHIGIYGYRKDFLMKFISLPRSPLETAESLEQLRVLENGYSIHVSVVDYDSIAVDTPEDVIKVEAVLMDYSSSSNKVF